MNPQEYEREQVYRTAIRQLQSERDGGHDAKGTGIRKDARIHETEGTQGQQETSGGAAGQPAA